MAGYAEVTDKPETLTMTSLPSRRQSSKRTSRHVLTVQLLGATEDLTCGDVHWSERPRQVGECATVRPAWLELGTGRKIVNLESPSPSWK